MERKFTIFALFYFVFEGKFQVQTPRGAYIQRDDLMEGIFALRFWGACIWRGLYIHGGAYFSVFEISLSESRNYKKSNL